jgi:orotidine-5'-phosphate decarboxylase
MIAQALVVLPAEIVTGYCMEYTAHNRLIFALDVDSRSEAQRWIHTLGDSVSFYKVGMELLTSGDYFNVIAELADLGKKVFVDLKFFDVPATVASAVKGLRRHRATFCTIHGNDGMMRAAVEVKGDLKVLAVTALTSLDQRDLTDLGFQCDAKTLVCSRAKAALALGVDGVVSSGLEAADIRAACGDKLLVVCPGIRPIENRVADDQKRTVDVAQAFDLGADFIVVGRPIRLAADPRQMAQEIQKTINQRFSANS